MRNGGMATTGNVVMTNTCSISPSAISPTISTRTTSICVRLLIAVLIFLTIRFLGCSFVYNRFLGKPLSSYSYRHNVGQFDVHGLHLLPDYGVPVQEFENGLSAVVLRGSEMEVNLTLASGDTIPGLHERRRVFSGGDGVSMAMVPQRTVTNLRSEAFDVSPRELRICSPSERAACGGSVRLAAPVTPTTSAHLKKWSTLFDHSVFQCQQMCAQRHMIDECGCWHVPTCHHSTISKMTRLRNVS